VSKCVAVARWRNCDTLHLWTNAAQHPQGDERHRCGHRTSVTRHRRDLHGISPGQRGAVAKRNLIRLRKQKLLRQVFERLQDRLLCTFLKAD
jgi:hypothetical protein